MTFPCNYGFPETLTSKVTSILVLSIYSYSHWFINPKLHTATELDNQSQSDSPTYLPTLTDDLSQIFTPCSIQLWIQGRGVENQVKLIGCKAVYHVLGSRVGWSMKSLYLYIIHSNDCDLVTIITAYILNTHGTNSCCIYSSTSTKVFYSLQI